MGPFAFNPDDASDFNRLKQDTLIWPKIRSHFQLDLNQSNSKIRAQRNWYLRHPKYLARVIHRATPYLYYISEEIKKRNMPMELALLPIVESAFDPFAYSHSRASGIWQFIPSTGKAYGLKQNWWYDGRRDVVASTEGAIKYLKYLHKF
ncbi:MAG: lytic transglycosylase, partial [Moraxellaceae bacterium]